MDLNLLTVQLTILFDKFKNRKDSCFILSASDLKSQAIVVHKYIKDESKDINDLINELNKKLNTTNTIPLIYKLDRIINKKEILYSKLKENFLGYKFGYFPYGISFDLDYNTVLLPAELHSNRILDDEQINFNNKYFKKRFQKQLHITDNNLLMTFETESYFLYDDSIFEILPQTNYRSILNKTNLNLIKKILRDLGNYLTINNQQNGQFNYLYFPIHNKYKPSYNILRHLGTIWSLIKLYQYFKWVDYKVVIYRAIKFILHNFLVKLDNLYFIKNSGLINCGATALAILVLTEYQTILNDTQYQVILDHLVKGLKFLQKQDGSFTHKLYINDLSVHTDFDTIYYHDEALFALMKYYELVKDESILNIVKLGLNYCIKNDTYKLMDHWLSYTLNEYTKYDDTKKYIDLAVNNFNLFLNFMNASDTIYNIMLELLCQSKIILDRFSDFKLEYDRDLFESVLTKRAQIQLDGFGWPEVAMYFNRPDLVLNSIFIRHKHFRIRIDDLQHTILGLLYYIQIQESKIL